MRIKYVITCPHCDKEVSYMHHDFTQESEEPIIIDLDMLGGFQMYCDCGCKIYVPDIADHIEADEDDCDDSNGDGEDEDE